MPALAGRGVGLTYQPGGLRLRSRDAPTALALGKGGRVTAVGSASRDMNSTDFAVARYRRDGGLDRSFGDDGVVTGDDIALARYKHNGELDGGFGVAGRVVTDLGHINNQARGNAIQPDGAIVVISNGALFRYAGR
jgi:hypothetical protein